MIVWFVFVFLRSGNGLGWTHGFFSLARFRSQERKSAGSEFLTLLTWRKFPEGVAES
jgi:hypothetical protein